ncbi:sarcoplasmic reticulum histidine-rich calcium-binding protein [Musca domestica]|uniref:Sarcoplasmic reticulum histidine-rich calcium-binding protein n=1 Tax=Musca domestica TaxID=7370 RepID=A0ABM3UUT3_MUSDO|nr:sarcoplasmic reticulum histidine-rich calcium-binding protein [Musca domestica]XP_058977290.1 sarcoplasmic reticulum histidine-rich calcium-binding protein [Musca domestica]XP_058977291.1 sarcoplasmic reticulum histidine-rich calcium-binding protein [Musca domestica]
MKLQPHLRKMFDFHTLVILVWCLTPMQTPRPTHGLLLEQQSNHSHPGHHHRHHHRHHYPRQQQLSHYHHTTPRIEDEEGEATTNTPLSLMDDNAITNREDEELLLFKGINSWSSSTTKPARHHRHQHYNHRHHSSEQQDKNQSRNGQHLILTSSSLSSPTSAASTSSKSSFSNSILEQPQQQQQQHHHHTHHQRGQPHHPHPQQSSSAASSPTQRLGPTPLPPLPSYFLSATTQKHNHPAGHGNGDGGGHQRRLSSKAAEDASPAERSKFSSHKTVSLERDNYQKPQQQHHQEHQNQNHHPTKHLQPQTKDLTMKRDYDDDDDLQGRHTRTPQEDADYYEEYNDSDDEDADDDNEEEDDIDGFADDTDNNLSDRSYARITRSKLDDDYVDDEPYRNAVDEEMQGDAPGVLTEQKYQELGNEKGVQQARERYIQEQKRPRTPHELATEHWQRMIHATKCRKPMPRVIPVSNNTSKRYEPYATILHRCGEDTGCCGSTASVCTVKRQEVVMVYVFSYDFNYRKEIEALPMQNHTECHCVNRASLQYESMPRGKRSGSWQHHHPRSSQLQKPPHHHQHKSHLQASAAAAASPMSRSDITSPGQPQYHHYSENMLSCHCPRHFSALEEDVERYAHLPRPHTVVTRKCRCDCLANNPTCLRFKHGEEGFALEDRKCIGEHDCKPPVCAFGEYNAQSGRCPTYRSHGKPKF